MMSDKQNAYVLVARKASAAPCVFGASSSPDVVFSATLLGATSALLVVTMFAIRNKCLASSNKCLTCSNKKLLETSALLLGARSY